MADISTELQAIMDAVYGEEVRGSIHDAIEKINEVSEDSSEEASNALETANQASTTANNAQSTADTALNRSAGAIEMARDRIPYPLTQSGHRQVGYEGWILTGTGTPYPEWTEPDAIRGTPWPEGLDPVSGKTIPDYGRPGNVLVSTGGSGLAWADGVDPEAIEDAVDTYLDEHGVETTFDIEDDNQGNVEIVGSNTEIGQLKDNVQRLVSDVPVTGQEGNVLTWHAYGNSFDAQHINAKVSNDGAGNVTIDGELGELIAEVVSDGEGTVTLETASDSSARITKDLNVVMLKNSKSDASDTRNIFGDCILIYNTQVFGMIDVGTDIQARALKAYCQANHLTKLDFLVVSHYHYDHITADFGTFLTNLSSVVDISDAIIYLPHKDIDWIATGMATTAAPRAGETNVLAAISSNNLVSVYPTNGQTVTFSDFTLRFLNTDPSYYTDYYSWMYNMTGTLTESMDYNSFSMLVELTHNSNVFLFASDATYMTEEKNYEDVKRCDVYKVEHHGLNIMVSNNWLSKLSPKYALIAPYADDYEEAYNFKRTAAVLSSKGTEIHSTLYDTIHLISNQVKVYNTSNSQLRLRDIAELSLYGAELLNPLFYSTSVKTDGKIDLDKFITIGEFYTNSASQNATSIYQTSIAGYSIASCYLRIKNTYENHNPYTIRQEIETIYPDTSHTFTRTIAVEYTTGSTGDPEISSITPRAWATDGPINISDSFCTFAENVTNQTSYYQVWKNGNHISAHMVILYDSGYATALNAFTIASDYRPLIPINTGCFLGSESRVYDVAYLYARPNGTVTVQDYTGRSDVNLKYAKIHLDYYI